MIIFFRFTKFLFTFFLMTSFSMLSLFSSIGLEGGVAVAQEEEEKKYKNVETRKRESVGKTCGSALDKVRGEKGPIFLAQAAEEAAAAAESSNKKAEEAINAAKTKAEKTLLQQQYKDQKVSASVISRYLRDSQRLWKDGEKALLNIESRAKTCASDYEQIQVWNMLAYTKYSLDDFPGATRYYEKIVNAPGEDDAFRLDTRRTLAQFYAQAERYSESIEQYEIWSARAFSVGATDRLMMAQLYSILKRKDKALEMAAIGISEAEAKGEVPKEGFWQVQVPIYYDRAQYKTVGTVLESLVKFYPKWTYWKQLGGMYGMQEREMDNLVSYEVVYLNDQLTSETDILQMAYFYLGAEVPYRAAKIIQKGMTDGIIEKTAKNYKTLADSWYQASELQQALGAYERASKLSDTGEIQFRIASIYLDLGQDKKAYDASLKAERKGAGKNTASNYNKMGSALINMYCFRDAVKAFNKAVKSSKDKKSQRYPRQWIKYANFEDDRYRKLRDAGATVRSCGKA